ncbi:kelch repeat and BTB domain-containing protein 13 [Hypomesus transpacificus]|uniref:kelch repeat and BTB domain-containing protein 13 n=1 Tax=Hypomesus transpacificus TaxID=137520 RepID=UPI001F075020|nr:kelch repeat and BTB domain-containing protein 13 [Hypomesus transpacificus]
MYSNKAMEWSSGESSGRAKDLVCALTRCESAKLKIVVGGAFFSTDKTLLVQSSGYFQALFRSGMRECEQEEIHIQGFAAHGFLIALAVLRDERPILDGDEIVAAIECAAFLQLAPLSKHLVDLIDSNNCLLMYHTAATFGLMDLYRAAAVFIRSMYADLEAEVTKHLPVELVTYVESLVPPVFVAVGAHPTCSLEETSHAATRTVCYLDEGDKDWKVLTALPPGASTSMAGVTVLDNKLYIVGGVQGVRKHAVDSCFCYDADTSEWSVLPGLRQLRYDFTLVGLDGRLYAIGGECEGTVMSSVESYDLATRTWSFVAHLPRPVSGAACTKTMSRIFVCLWKPMETTDIYEYLPGKDEWLLVTTLIRHQSYGHCLVGHRDDLYVMRNGPSADFLRCIMDCYNLTTGQWTALPGHFANSKGSLFTAVVRGDSVFTLNRTVTLEYVIEGKTWKPRNQMKGFPRNGSVWTFFLQLPRRSVMDNI